MKTLVLIIVLCLFYSCNSSKQMKNNQLNSPSPHIFIYKTKGDYYLKVPILLAENKVDIVSYPAPTDLIIKEKLSLPTKLLDGYYLDNRGINVNVAFIQLKYSEYSKLSHPPKIDDLKQMIIDNDPLVELYDCGVRTKYKNIEEELNKIINKGNLTCFKRIK